MCKLDLEAGSYALIPFTSGCHLKPREDEEREEAVALVREEGGKTVLTDACRCVCVCECVCVCVWLGGGACTIRLCCILLHTFTNTHTSTHCHYREALTEVFHRMDLDGNSVISRTEFDFFQERTSGEVCDDDTWKIIQGT